MAIIQAERRHMKISRWGNSLAIRLPASMIREMSLAEGDDVDVVLATRRPKKARTDEERKAALERIAAMSFPLPPDWKFDREEANAR